MENTVQITEDNYLDHIGEMQGTDYYGVSNDTHYVEEWPESQDIMDRDDVLLVNDEIGLELFGGSAYVVPKDVRRHEVSINDLTVYYVDEYGEWHDLNAIGEEIRDVQELKDFVYELCEQKFFGKNVLDSLLEEVD